MQQFEGVLREAAVRAGAEFEGTGVACPGPINPYTGLVGEVGTLPGWRGRNLVVELQPEFGVPVPVENVPVRQLSCRIRVFRTERVAGRHQQTGITHMALTAGSTGDFAHQALGSRISSSSINDGLPDSP